MADFSRGPHFLPSRYKIYFLSINIEKKNSKKKKKEKTPNYYSHYEVKSSAFQTCFTILFILAVKISGLQFPLPEFKQTTKEEEIMK